MINAVVGKSKDDCEQIGCSISFCCKSWLKKGEGEEACPGCGACDTRLASTTGGSEVEERRKCADYIAAHAETGYEVISL